MASRVETSRARSAAALAPVMVGHFLRRPAEQQHQVAGVPAGELPLVGEGVPPPVRV
jgi:hypothetical protein